MFFGGAIAMVTFLRLLEIVLGPGIYDLIVLGLIAAYHTKPETRTFDGRPMREMQAAKRQLKEQMRRDGGYGDGTGGGGGGRGGGVRPARAQRMDAQHRRRRRDIVRQRRRADASRRVWGHVWGTPRLGELEQALCLQRFSRFSRWISFGRVG